MKEIRPIILTVLFFVILALGTFRCALGSDKVFSGSDSNIGLLMAAHERLPEAFNGSYLPTPLFGAAGKVPFSFSNLGKSLFDPVVFSNISYAFYLILASVFLVAYLRLWKLRWLSCLLGALAAFWVGSISLNASGHLGKLGVMAFFSVALYLLEKAVRTNRPVQRLAYAASGGVAIGLMLLEQQDVGLLAGLFLGPYVIFRLYREAGKNVLTWGSVLIPVALIGLLMAASTALDAYSANVTQTGMKSDSQEKWNFVTQWSMVPSEWPDLVAPGYMGLKTGHPELPYWGAAGQSAEWASEKKGFRNFRLDSVYIGIIPVLLAFWAFLLACKGLKRKDGDISSVVFFWGIMAFIALLLSMGKFSLLYKGFYHLPLIGNIRAPIKLLQNFQVIIGILTAFGANQILGVVDNDKESRVAPIAKWAFSVVAVLMLFLVFSSSVSGGDAFVADWGTAVAEKISRGITQAWLHAAIMAILLSAMVFLRSAGKITGAKANIGMCVLIGAVVFDSWMISGRYFEAADISHLRRGNLVINYLKNNQGDDRVYFLRQDGPYAGWISMESQYHGLNKFNIWQMPRMPEEYKTFLGSANKNPIRLWQLSSIRYITAPAGIMSQLTADKALGSMFKPVMYYRFVREGAGIGIVQLSKPEAAQDQVLLEFDTIPRFALFHNWEPVAPLQQCEKLFSPDFDPAMTVLVDPSASVPSPVPGMSYSKVEAETSLQDAVIKTSASSPGILLFTQRYQGGWKVFVDGEEADLLKCNYLCMGVVVPAGKHEVQFVYD